MRAFIRVKPTRKEVERKRKRQKDPTMSSFVTKKNPRVYFDLQIGMKKGARFRFL